MSRSARYVTQQSVFATPYTGPLTDRAIERYRKAGYYDGIKRDERKEQRAKKAKSKSAKKSKIDILKLLLS